MVCQAPSDCRRWLERYGQSGVDGKGLVCYAFAQKETGIPLVAFWDASNHPENDNTVHETVLSFPGVLKDPVWMDLVTGAIYQIPKRMLRGSRGRVTTFEGIPYYDSPTVVTERSLVME